MDVSIQKPSIESRASIGLKTPGKSPKPALQHAERGNSYVMGFLLVLIGFILSLLLLRCLLTVSPPEPIGVPKPIQPVIVQYLPESFDDYINYASNFNGAKIKYEQSSPQLHGILSGLSSNSLESLLSNSNAPGECWAFGGQYGYAAITLAEQILPLSFSLHHLNLVNYETAPKEFNVWSLDWPESRLLGSYTMEMGITGEKRRTSKLFPCQYHCDTLTSEVLLEVTSNYGAEATCVYEFRVHGEPLNI